MPPLPTSSPHPSLRIFALWAEMVLFIGTFFSLALPFIPDTVADGRVGGAMEGGRPRHPRLFQPRPVARIHGVGALHVPVVVPVGVGVSPVFDFDRGPGLPPQMLRRLESRLSLPGNRERQGQALLGAWWWFHHSAKPPQTMR